MAKVSYNSNAILIDNKPEMIISGAVHYPRATPAMWPAILRESKNAGLNTIETYVFWNLHEHQRGHYDFTGRLDLPRFLDLCHQQKLHVILRIGPYICAETNFGGLPPWLLDVKGLVSRTNNEPFKQHMLEWCKVLMAKVGDYQATRGGPIILAQIENEYNNVAARYGREGQAYVEWCASLAPILGLTVPMIMCEGQAKGVISTLNGFLVAKSVARHRQHHPNQPILWTENWPGWYDTFGYRHHTRDRREIAYNVLRFFAVGGTGVNYYMWFGGTNFAREAMYLQTTSYDFDAPLDEYGLPTSKSRHLGHLHQAILANKAFLLTGRDPKINVVVPPMEGQTLPQLAVYTFKHGNESLLFAINSQKTPANITAGHKTLHLEPQSAQLLKQAAGQTRVIFSSHEKPMQLISRCWKPLTLDLQWQEFTEPLHRPELSGVTLDRPASMLPHTHDLTDYAFYNTELTSAAARTVTLTLPMVRDFSTVFLNGVCLGSQPARLLENNTGEHWKHTYTLPLRQGQNSLQILVSALGLIKGDWMIDAPMTEEKKGLIGHISINGRQVRMTWQLSVGLMGEYLRCFQELPGQLVPWRRLSARTTAPLRWFRTTFGPLSPTALGYAIHPGSLYKGMFYLNGHHLGRYWQVPALDKKEAGDENVLIAGSPAGEPVQCYYHLPKELLQKVNSLVVFEETTASPAGLRVHERTTG